MAIADFDRPHFEAALKVRLSPTTPIRSVEFLRGRDRKLEDIRRALVADGRHIFIYGDRGVGKTSLAQTAAYEHQSADHNPIFLACDTSSGFYRIAHDLATALIQADPTVAKKTNTRKVGLTIRSLISGEAQVAIERGVIPEMGSINKAVGVIEFAARFYARAPVVVIDEFERVKEAQERMLFADFIKQIGDQSIPIKLIFCGVG
ncbi:MAG TPA: ATP-binding protein, partial [Acetobacteraceae bacterium]|nr:ATP-binding protein [Acetobacteraceae bacterium]